jgi:hypothetical protein
MIGYFKRLLYRRRVLPPLYALLYAYPRGVNQIIRDFPGLDGAIDTFRKQGLSVETSALLCASVVLTNVLEATPPGAVGKIKEQLAGTDLRDFLPLLADIQSGQRAELPNGMTLGTLLAGVAMRMARSMRDEGRVSEVDYRRFLSEIDGALSEKTFQERSTERISHFLTDLMSQD